MARQTTLQQTQIILKDTGDASLHRLPKICLPTPSSFLCHCACFPVSLLALAGLSITEAGGTTISSLTTSISEYCLRSLTRYLITIAHTNAAPTDTFKDLLSSLWLTRTPSLSRYYWRTFVENDVDTTAGVFAASLLSHPWLSLVYGCHLSLTSSSRNHYKLFSSAGCIAAQALPGLVTAFVAVQHKSTLADPLRLPGALGCSNLILGSDNS
ncbi:hypothetical protein CVT26_005174 [Gymnopilus dilepis]|uniref:Uncharacterized protein n=1 Tax=Gymnopilus dilepis TaxID=231916 RepID=A0A409WH97_9AGAR|nr:hypothetical protein CVT26_005174 [Gymnopilus dilepis]